MRRNTKQFSAMDYAVYSLSQRLQSSGQLRQKMHKKGYPDAEIDEVIQRLTELHYLNDEQFAQIYFENLKKYKQFGYYGIKRKLLDKRVSQAQVNRLLAELSAAEELTIAKRLLQRYRSKNGEQQIRALQGKGFRSEVIMKAVKKSAGIAQELDEQEPPGSVVSE